MKVTDPVCGMQIDSESAVGQVEWQGHNYYFCGTGCKAGFECEPQRFVHRDGSIKARAHRGVRERRRQQSR